MRAAITFSILFVLGVCTLSASDKVNPITSDVPPLHPAPIATTSETGILDNIISLTKENLQNEMKLRDQVVLYRDLYDNYMENTANRELLYRVVKAAYEVEFTMTSTNLQHAFSPNFLRELSLFANVAKKRSVPRP